MNYEELDERDKILYRIAEQLIEWYDNEDVFELYDEKNDELVSQETLDELAEFLDPMELIYPLFKDTEMDEIRELEDKADKFFAHFEKNDFRFPTAEKKVKRMYKAALYSELLD